MIAVVTCTGGRPELFELTKRWVDRQTVRPDVWVITNDVGDPVGDLPGYARLHLIESQGAFHALSAALSFVPSGFDVVVMEDDDWYAPDHVEKAVKQLRHHRIVQVHGEHRFHLPGQLRIKAGSASPIGRFVPGLASFRWESIDDVIMMLGKNGRSRIHSYDGGTVVGIKGVGYGLPGRTGATSKHNQRSKKMKRWKPDRDNNGFRSLLGVDADAYLSLLP